MRFLVVECRTIASDDELVLGKETTCILLQSVLSRQVWNDAVRIVSYVLYEELGKRLKGTKLRASKSIFQDAYFNLIRTRVITFHGAVSRRPDLAPVITVKADQVEGC